MWGRMSWMKHKYWINYYFSIVFKFLINIIKKIWSRIYCIIYTTINVQQILSLWPKSRGFLDEIGYETRQGNIYFLEIHGEDCEDDCEKDKSIFYKIE